MRPSAVATVIPHHVTGGRMELGAFSISLSVADLGVSRSFYENLGFSAMGGDGETWSILVNGPAVIGLFHGMFEGNILTFNPGWTGEGQALEDFTDIRDIATALTVLGVAPENATTGDSSSGPASFTLTDPDGNALLIDQHV